MDELALGLEKGDTIVMRRLFKVADPRHIAIWISGFYHGKSGSTVIDVQALKNSADKVSNYCRSNIKLTVMQAVDALFGPPK